MTSQSQQTDPKARQDNTKSVGLINFHYSLNHGAVLQASALSRVLSGLGSDVHTIDYRPYDTIQSYEPIPDPFASAVWAYRGSLSIQQSRRKALESAGRRVTRIVLEYPTFAQRAGLRRMFDEYIERHLNLTRRYSSLRSLIADAPAMDSYISGSDQLWNPVVTGGLDPAYFLRFGPRDATRATYAVSPVQLDVARHADALRHYTASLDYVSLRERDKQAELSKVLGREVLVNVDPTLLLEQADLAALEEPTELSDRPYVLAYLFRDAEYAPRIKNAVETIAQRDNLAIVDASLQAHDIAIQGSQRFVVNPGQFLSAVKNAAVIVTNSFHATVFSILYGRPFLTIPRARADTRLTELLSSLGLGIHLLTSDEVMPGQLGTGNGYADAKERVAPLKREALEYLTNILAAPSPNSATV